VHRNDRILQGGIGLVLEAQAGLDPLESGMPALARPGFGRSGALGLNGPMSRGVPRRAISAAPHDWYTICQMPPAAQRAGRANLCIQRRLMRRSKLLQRKIVNAVTAGPAGPESKTAREGLAGGSIFFGNCQAIRSCSGS